MARYTRAVPLARTPRAPRLSRGAVIAATYVVFALIAIVGGARYHHTNLYRYPGATTSLARMIGGPLAGVAIGLVAVWLSRWAVHRLDWARTLHREFHSVVHELSAGEIWLLAAMSAVGEELVFRGALQPTIGLVPAAALFALVHFRPQLRFLPWTLMSLIVGLVFGGLYVRFGDLGAPIAAHFTINLLNLRYISRTQL